MKRNEERYGTTYPNESSRSEQFHKPLHWTSSVSPEGVLAEGASFVEYAVPLWKVKKRMVSFRWWKKSTSPAMLQKLIREHTEANYSTLKDDDDLLTIPVNELKSTYDFEMRDVSKLEDRENWVARGQIHLTRRSDKALVAEYVGLAAAQIGVQTGRWSPYVLVPSPTSLMAIAGSRCNSFSGVLCDLREVSCSCNRSFKYAGVAADPFA